MKHYAVTGGLLSTADDDGGHHYHSDSNPNSRLVLGEESAAMKKQWR